MKIGPYLPKLLSNTKNVVIYALDLVNYALRLVKRALDLVIYALDLSKHALDLRRVALRSAPVTCATAVAHSLMQRLR